MQPPSLTIAALTHQLTRMFAGNREHRPLIAIHGACEDPGPIDLPNVGRFEVVVADSEIDLRRELREPAPAAPPRTVYLVPWTTHLPLDIAGQFSHDGRVFRIDDEVRISRLFTAPFESIDPEVFASELTAWLVRMPAFAPLPSPGGRLTFLALWNTWLRHTWDLDLETAGPSALLAWAAGNEKGPRLADLLASDHAMGVRLELETLLDRRLGALAPVILRAWLRDHGTQLLGFAILCETLAPKAEKDAALRTWLALKAEPFFDAKADSQHRHALLVRLGNLVAPTFGELGRLQQRGTLRAALDAADALADDHVREALIDSNRLPSSWQQRLAVLGGLLREAAARPTHDHLTRAIEALRRLEAHDRPRYSREGRATGELARAEAGVRLLAWLVARTDTSLTATQDRSERTEQLARWYVDEGAHLDNARHLARGSTRDPFGSGLAAIVTRVDDERRALDRQFADGLVAWSFGRAPTHAIPIADALDRLCVRFLQEHAARRLLVVLIPGMAWTQALELLASLDEDASRWGPLAWHGFPENRPAVPCPAVLATIPATSTISRAALLGGELVPAGILPASGNDRQRLAEHRSLARLLPSAAAPPLFHRHALDDAAGTEVLAQIRDPQARWVGVLLDGIDAAHQADAPHLAAWRARNIRPLFELLDAARAAGRAVLLASDHGQVPAGRLQSTGEPGSEGGARWRPWTAGATVHSYETAFRSEDAWGPRGSQGVIVIHDEEHRYTPSTGAAGEHGGATLPEVVTPMFLLGWEGMDVEHRDPALALRPAMPPRWWHLHVEPPPPRETRRPKSARIDTGPQLPLLPVTPPAATTAAPTTASRHPLLRLLLASPIFEVRAAEARQRELAERAVEALLAHGSSAHENILAPALGMPARRVGGFIVKASEVLNIDGYAVLHFDPVNHLAVLHEGRLRQCFEL